MKGALVLKPLDFGAIGLVLSITVLSGVFVYAGTGSQKMVHITGMDAQWVFPLDSAEIITVPGPLGDTVVELQEGKVWVRSSPCGNQTCVAAGAIQSHGQWIVCLPNQALVLIKGKSISSSGEYDEELDGAIW